MPPGAPHRRLTHLLIAAAAFALSIPATSSAGEGLDVKAWLDRPGTRLMDECLTDVAYRQWVFSLPKALRIYFRFDRELFKGLSRIVVDGLTRYMREVTGHEDLEPGFVVWDHTFGTLPDSYHPHPHVCATDGGYLPDGRFVPLPRARRKDTEALCEVLRHRVIGWLLKKGKLSEELAGSLLSWGHSGFSLDATRRVAAGRRDRLEDLLLYMSRHPFVAGGIHYDAVSGTVHYRAFRKHRGRDTDTISVDAVEFIAILAQHIPHARRHQVRYYGACTPEVRKRLGLSGKPPQPLPRQAVMLGIGSGGGRWRQGGVRFLAVLSRLIATLLP